MATRVLGCGHTEVSFASRNRKRPWMHKRPAEASFEKLMTFGAAADALGIPYFKIQRAAKAKLFPTYRLLNGRPLLRLSEVVAAIDASREGIGP